RYAGRPTNCLLHKNVTKGNHHDKTATDIYRAAIFTVKGPMLAPLTLAEQLHQLLEHRLLTPVFQPIVALDGPDILGYEALIRGPIHTILHTPDKLFEVARESHQLAALEYACREVSCEKFV